MTTYQDLVIEELVESEAMLLERVKSLEDDVQSYRFWLCQALAQLATMTKQLDRARRVIRKLQSIIRQLQPDATRTAA